MGSIWFVDLYIHILLMTLNFSIAVNTSVTTKMIK